jgi:hypothetical protein
MYTISNKDGMRALASYVVYDTSEGIVAMDVVGAETAVKAIVASLHLGRDVTVDIGWPQRLCVATRFRVIRSILAAGLYRYHVVPTFSPDAQRIPVYGWNAVRSEQDALVGALARWTVYPVLPEWAEALFQLGVELGLVRWMWKAGAVDYAFWVESQGWEEAINRGISEGKLVIN